MCKYIRLSGRFCQADCILLIPRLYSIQLFRQLAQPSLRKQLVEVAAIAQAARLYGQGAMSSFPACGGGAGCARRQAGGAGFTCCPAIFLMPPRSRRWCRRRNRPWASSNPRRQRRHHPGQPVRAIARRGLGRGHQGQPDCDLSPGPRRDQADDAQAFRPHHRDHSVVGVTGNPGQGNYTARRPG